MKRILIAASTALGIAVAATAASAQTASPPPVAPQAPSASPKTAEIKADQFAMDVVKAWQSGGDLAALLDAKMRKVVDEQTNGTGVYRQVKALGPVNSAEILGEQTLESKVMTAVKVTHEKGASILVFSRKKSGGLATWISLADVGDKAASARPMHPMCFVLGKDAC